jgi:transposase
MRPRGRKNKVYSGEFKIAAVERMRREGLNYHEAVRELRLGDHNDGGGRCALKRWERIYLEEGAKGLMEERRGKAAKTGRPPKLEKAVEEDLIVENQRLRMENEYLKKLHALTLSRMSEKGTKPE